MDIYHYCLTCKRYYTYCLCPPEPQATQKVKDPKPMHNLTSTSNNGYQHSTSSQGHSHYPHQAADHNHRTGTNHHHNQQQQQAYQTVQVDKRQKKQAERQVLATDTYFRLLTGIDVLLNKCGFNNPIQFPQFNLTDASSDVQDMLLDIDGLCSSLVIFHKEALHDGKTPPTYEQIGEYAKYYNQFMEIMPNSPEGNAFYHSLRHLIQAFRAGKFEFAFSEVLSERIMSSEMKKKLANVQSAQDVTNVLKLTNVTQNIMHESAAQIEKNVKELMERQQQERDLLQQQASEATQPSDPPLNRFDQPDKYAELLKKQYKERQQMEKQEHQKAVQPNSSHQSWTPQAGYGQEPQAGIRPKPLYQADPQAAHIFSHPHEGKQPTTYSTQEASDTKTLSRLPPKAAPPQPLVSNATVHNVRIDGSGSRAFY